MNQDSYNSNSLDFDQPQPPQSPVIHQPPQELNEFIKSSVENLIPIPSEFEGIPEHMCDFPSHDNSPPLDISTDQIEDLSESNEEFSSIDDDSFSIDDIDYVEASPPDSELVSFELCWFMVYFSFRLGYDLGTVDQTQNVYAAGAYNQGGNSYQPQGNRTLLSYRSDNYLGPPGFNQNQNRSNPNQNYQNRNQGNNNENPQGNNPGRNQFFQGASHVQNPPPAYQAPSYQSPGYQAPVQQALIPQPQVVTTTEFTNYMKENDNMFGQFMKMNTTSSSGSKTLPSNTITNPKEDLKGITTRSGIAYKGPTIPTTSSPPKVAEHETKVTKDTVPPTNNGSTKDVQPLVVHVETQVPNSGPVVAPVVEPVEAPPGRALIDVYEGELTLRVGNKAVTFNLYQTSRYFANYDAELINQIDVIDVACKEYSQEVLGFSVSGNPTPSTEPIVSTSSPTLTLFGDSDFLREETDAFLAIEDEPISSKTDDSYYDSNRDILLLKEFLNDDPHHHLSLQKNLKSLNLKMKNILLMNHPWLNLRTYHLILNMHFWRVMINYPS
nr:reverse transcriptase domain-containing protein [Tanacetum cinerariifolium]